MLDREDYYLVNDPDLCTSSLRYGIHFLKHNWTPMMSGRPTISTIIYRYHLGCCQHLHVYAFSSFCWNLDTQALFSRVLAVVVSNSFSCFFNVMVDMASPVFSDPLKNIALLLSVWLFNLLCCHRFRRQILFRDDNCLCNLSLCALRISPTVSQRFCPMSRVSALTPQSL